MSLQYTRAELKSEINAGIKNKQGILVAFNDIVNRAVRQVISDVDLRSCKRTASLSPRLFTGIYDYAAPSDLKRRAIIDVYPQGQRTDSLEYNLVMPEEFERSREGNTITVDDSDIVKKLRISANISDNTLVIGELDTVGSWTALSGTTNLVATSDNYIHGVGGLSWDIDGTSSATAGITNYSITNFDWTIYRQHSAFLWQYIPNKDNITNFILKIGDPTNYITTTITTQSDGTAFKNGWNLLRWDLSNAVETGTIDTTTGSYASIVMTKALTKINVSGFISDYLVLKKGQIHQVSYYSKYGWQNAAGTYIEESTDDSDYIVADTDEINMFIFKGTEYAAGEVDEEKIEAKSMKRYEAAVDKYTLENPSEAKLITSTYYKY